MFLGAAGTVVSGRTCPDGSYLNVFQVQAGAQCPSAPVVNAPPAPVYSAPAAPSAPPSAPPPVYSPPQNYSQPQVTYAPPAVIARESFVTRIPEMSEPLIAYELSSQAASAGNTAVPFGANDAGMSTGGGGDVLTATEVKTTVVPEKKFPWWLLAIASAVIFNA